MVPQATIVIFEKHLGKIVFAQKYIKTKIFSKVLNKDNCSDFFVFH